VVGAAVNTGERGSLSLGQYFRKLSYKLGDAQNASAGHIDFISLNHFAI